MARYILITKTKWDEPPRIRHQLAQLLSDAGHDVVFFEKPSPVWRRPEPPRSVGPNIVVLGCHELIHHKLRLLTILHRLNRWVTLRSLRAGLARLDNDSPSTVINFNYEYYFVDDVVPGSRVITIINDDHTATALFGWQRPLQWALQRTCEASDRVLTVSRPLVDKLQQFCKPELFWPWTDRPYTPPSQEKRDTLLFWGYINDRLDYELLGRLADTVPGRRILLVGPQQRKVSEEITRLVQRDNVEIRDTAQLDELPMERVLAGLIPYRSGSELIDAIELSNKALRLLSNGLPLLISGMPNFIDAPFVLRLDGNDTPADVVRHAEQGFYRLQDDIQAFVAANGPTARLRQLLE